MSAYYNYGAHHQPQHGNPTHHRNSRRAPRMSVAQQNARGQYRGGVRNMSMSSESVRDFRNMLEAASSFDLEDDMAFCPQLLTDEDFAYLSGPDSSQASSSPHSSPTQPLQVVAPTFSLNSSSPAFVPPTYTNVKMHQPAATRGRNAIPIVNPSTGASMSSPPQSVSPGRMHQSMGRRW